MRCECLFSLDWWCVRRTAANARADAASATSGSIVPADAPFVSILAIPEPEVSKLPSSRQAICGFGHFRPERISRVSRSRMIGMASEARSAGTRHGGGGRAETWGEERQSEGGGKGGSGRGE